MQENCIKWQEFYNGIIPEHDDGGWRACHKMAAMTYFLIFVLGVWEWELIGQGCNAVAVSKYSTVVLCIGFLICSWKVKKNIQPNRWEDNANRMEGKKGIEPNYTLAPFKASLFLKNKEIVCIWYFLDVVNWLLSGMTYWLRQLRNPTVRINVLTAANCDDLENKGIKTRLSDIHISITQD